MKEKLPTYIIDLKRKWAECLSIQYSLDIMVSKKGRLYDPCGYYRGEDDIIYCFTEAVDMSDDFTKEEAKILEWNTGIKPSEWVEDYDEGGWSNV